MTTRLKKQSSRKSAAASGEKPLRSSLGAPPALSGWLDSQRASVNTTPTAQELARNIKRNLFAE